MVEAVVGFKVSCFFKENVSTIYFIVYDWHS